MKQYLSLVKFSHTIFALPFALLGFFLAIFRLDVQVPWITFLYVLLCMIFARNAAMAFNRYLDRDIDGKNPRTVVREGYSYTKRFTFLCHFVLGLGLALAPIGAYLAAGGNFDLLPLLYGLSVLFWVSGFDIIYALQDEDFDRKHQLSSVPVILGGRNALRLSTALHVGCAVTMASAGYVLLTNYPTAGWLSGIATFVFLGLLVYQHTLVKPHDLSKINLAFFTTNGFASVLLGSTIIFDLLF